MSATIVLTAGTLPEGTCFTTPQAVLDLYVANITGTLPGNFTSFNYGNSEPAVEDRDKPWFRLNANDSPDKWYVFFNGEWVSRHPLPTGFVSLFTGTLTELQTYDGGDTDPASASSGPMWEEVTALRARFPIGPGTLPSTTVVAVTNTGGEETHTLTTAEMPSHTHGQNIMDTTSTAAVMEVSGPTGGGTDGNKATKDPLTDGTRVITDATGGGGAHNNLPPYYGIYFIRRTSRLYYATS